MSPGTVGTKLRMLGRIRRLPEEPKPRRLLPGFRIRFCRPFSTNNPRRVFFRLGTFMFLMRAISWWGVVPRAEALGCSVFALRAINPRLRLQFLGLCPSRRTTVFDNLLDRSKCGRPSFTLA